MEEMTRENAREEVFTGIELEDCVNFLYDFKQKGESVVVDFNGHKLYSCDITLNKAYKEVTGMTKKEYDKGVAERQKRFQYNELLKNVLLQDMSRTKTWLNFEELKEILPQEKYEELMDDIKTREEFFAKSSGLSGQELEQEVENEIKDKIFIILQDEQNDFYVQEELTSHKFEFKILVSPIEMNAQKLAGVVQKAMQKHLDYGKFDSNEYITAEEIQKTLEYDIDLTNTYLKKDKEDNLEKEGKDLSDKYVNLEQDWKERGKKVIYPERIEHWEKVVDTLSKTYRKQHIDFAVDLMEKIENGTTVEEAIDIFAKEDYHIVPSIMIRSMLFYFSKKGPEFWEKTKYGGEFSEEEKKEIEEKKRENSELEIKELARTKKRLETELGNTQKNIEDIKAEENKQKGKTDTDGKDEK